MLYALGIAIQSGNQRILGVLILYHRNLECQAVCYMLWGIYSDEGIKRLVVSTCGPFGRHSRAVYQVIIECQAVYAMECLTIRSENASIFEPLVVKGLLLMGTSGFQPIE